MARSILLALLAVAGSTGRLDSCYGYEDHLTLMPDRSGKLELVLSAKTADSSLDKTKADILKVANDTSGYAAFTAPTLEVKDGWAIARFTVYFEDINLFYYVEGRKHDNERPADTRHETCLHFWVMPRPNDKNSFMLHVEDWIFSKSSAAWREGAMPWEEIKKDRENLVKRRVTVPGKVKDHMEFQRLEGRTVTYERSLETVKKPYDVIEFNFTGSRRVYYDGNEVTGDDLSRFKKELDDAKAAWPRVKSDLEAARAKQAK